MGDNPVSSLFPDLEDMRIPAFGEKEPLYCNLISTLLDFDPVFYEE